MTDIRSEITASVWKVDVTAGQAVKENDEIIILESMKMEIPVVATVSGTVTAVHVKPSDQVTEGHLLVTID